MKSGAFSLGTVKLNYVTGLRWGCRVESEYETVVLKEKMRARR